MSPVTGLDTDCGTCGRRAGDHTLDEWAKCMGTVTTDLPYEDNPHEVRFAGDQLREQLGLEQGTIVADHVVVKAAYYEGLNGVATVRMPMLIHEFAMGRPGAPPAPVGKAVFLADSEGMRKYGQLVRDSANGAINAARRAS